jgi:UDPglucose 6-dehydrogenase
MKISIVGTGYVGLVTGTCFSEVGLGVTCIDIDSGKIENLKKGKLPIYEPGLKEMVLRNLKNGRLKFSTDLASSIQDSDVAFIAVGTPPDEDGSADLKHVLGVAKEIGDNMRDYCVVVTKSTVPVGTAKKVREEIKSALDKKGESIEFDVASNPEFLKEGAAVQDFLRPDRIVIGVESERAQKILQKLYHPFTLNGHPLIMMDIPSAEMTKYAANSMLATKISFMNDVANLCELLGADVNMVRKGIGTDLRIGDKFIYPGIGYGGSCFPKDVKALISTAEDNNYDLKVLKAVEEVNQRQKEVLFRKMKARYGNNLKDKTVAIWGLSFKPKTNDMREAPSLILIQNLIEEGCKVRVYDPVAMPEAQETLGDRVEFGLDPYDVLEGADFVSIVTEWSEFRSPDFEKIGTILTDKVIFDGRNIYDPEEMKEHGFEYHCIGLLNNTNHA